VPLVFGLVTVLVGDPRMWYTLMSWHVSQLVDIKRMKKIIGSFVVLSFLLIGIPSTGVFAQSDTKQVKKTVAAKKKQAPKQVIVKKKQAVKPAAKPVKQVKQVKPVKLAKPLKVKTAPKAKVKVKKQEQVEQQEQEEVVNEENNEELLDLEEELENVTKELESAEKLVEEEKAVPTPTPSPVPSGDAPFVYSLIEGPVWDLSEKEKKARETKEKLESLKKKISEIKKIEPVEVKKIESPIKAPLKNIGNPLTDTYENEDKPMREYWRTHPGSYGPPLLKYNLPSGIF